jgi:hypothetical protein
LAFDVGEFVLTMDEQLADESCEGVALNTGFEMVFDSFPNLDAFRLVRTQSVPPPPPTPRPSVAPRDIPCGGDSSLHTLDTAGVVVSCARAAIEQDELAFGPVVVDAGDDGSTVRIGWVGDSCSSQTVATVSAPGDEIVVELVESQLTPCDSIATPRAIELTFDHPVLADSVTLTRGGNAFGYDRADTSDGRFELQINSSRGQFRAGDPIDVSASLVWRGNDVTDTIELAGPFGDEASDLIGFGFEQLDGALAISPAWRMSCNPYQLRRDEPASKPYSKSGGIADPGPDAEFWRDYFDDPSLTLPPGTYRVFAKANFDLDTICISGQIRLEASIVIQVQ